MKMKKTSLNTTKVTDRKIKRLYLVAATVVAAAFVMAMPAFADDPLATINNLSDFVFSAIKAIGAILLGFGIVQIGLALKGHDASQRAQGFMTMSLTTSAPLLNVPNGANTTERCSHAYSLNL